MLINEGLAIGVLHEYVILAQFVKCLCRFSYMYKCRHYHNHAEATVMRLPCFVCQYGLDFLLAMISQLCWHCLYM